MSTNGKEKLIAKIQHYYDALIGAKQMNEDAAMGANDHIDKEHRKLMGQCFHTCAVQFEEIFKEFLYNADGNES